MATDGRVHIVADLRGITGSMGSMYVCAITEGPVVRRRGSFSAVQIYPGTKVFSMSVDPCRAESSSGQYEAIPGSNSKFSVTFCNVVISAAFPFSSLLLSGRTCREDIVANQVAPSFFVIPDTHSRSGGQLLTVVGGQQELALLVSGGGCAP